SLAYPYLTVLVKSEESLDLVG
uniref:Uncharacterized protein n=1 Tax=Acrobeloides nanus TaxID=290746 RepID=A0A914D3Z7_9BILA